MASDLVTLEVFADQMIADLAKGALEARGIAAIASADDCGGMEPQLQLVRGVRLLVTRENEAAAREVLAELKRDGAEWAAEDSPDETDLDGD